MEGTEVLGRLSWLTATLADSRMETPRVRTLVFDCPGWESPMAGQHADIRLTSEDGYQAQRSYSIGSAPGDDHLVLTVERLQDGEVSPYLVDVMEPGDQMEIRGPIGRYFVWEASQPEPVLMIAGGSGVVPFRSMLRHHAAIGSIAPMRLLYSSRSWDDVIYRDELAAMGSVGPTEVIHTLTRSRPEGWSGYGRRIDAGMIAEVAYPPERHPLTYVCGPTAFVETAAAALVELGHDPLSVRTERFGPSG